MELNFEFIKESIQECRQCNVTENSIFITTHTGMGTNVGIHWACHDDINRIKVYFLHNFIIHAMLFHNLFTQTEIIRLEFIKSF